MKPEKQCRFLPMIAGLLLLATAATAATNAPASLLASLGASNPATEADHQRMMDLLKITSLRRGRDGSNTNSPFYANYDESKANPFPDLPDPLVMKNGAKVTTAEIWWDRRRPEIVEDFDREIYGHVPANTPKVDWLVVSKTLETNGTVPVIIKKLIGRVDDSLDTNIPVNIQLTLATPVNANAPVPVILQLTFNFGGFNRLRGTNAFPRAGSNDSAMTSWQRQVLARGWGYAMLTPTSVQADNGAGLAGGIIGLMNRDSRASRMIGAHCGRGRGVPAACWIILRPMTRWTPGGSGLKAIRVMAKRRWWRWRMTRVLRWLTSVPPAKAGQNCIVATGVKRWKMSPAAVNIIGWPATSSNMLVH